MPEKKKTAKAGKPAGPKPPEKKDPAGSRGASNQAGGESFAEELGVTDLRELVFGSRGKLFSTAGKHTPIAEFTDEQVILHPPQMPYMDEKAGSGSERIEIRVDDAGIMLDDLGNRRQIAGAKINGYPIYCLGETMKGTLKHYAGWLDTDGKVRKIMFKGQPTTVERVYQLRNRTFDGEISFFSDVERVE